MDVYGNVECRQITFDAREVAYYHHWKDLDGEEEYIIYTETVGTIRAEDKDAEKDFYKFVEEAGW